jgi:hypothetical protein
MIALCGAAAWLCLFDASLAATPNREGEGGEPVSLDGRDARESDGLHSLVSLRLEALAGRIDSFFGDDRVYEEETGTFVRAGSSVQWREGGSWEFTPQLQLKLSLPRTERRLRLVVDFEGEEQADRDTSFDEDALTVEGEDTRRLSAGAEVGPAKGNWKVTPGVRLLGRPDPFVRGRVWRAFLLDPWELRLTQRTFWFLEDGLGAGVEMDFERPVGEGHLVRASSAVEWSADDGNVAVKGDLFFFQRWTDRDAIGYRGEALGETKPGWQVVRYLLSVNYRRRLYEKWLFAGIEPALIFPGDDDFRPSWSALVKFEGFWGGRYL